MSDYSLELKQIKENLSPVRDTEIRRKAGLMVGVMEAKSVRLGCRLYGVCPKTFYAWLKKLKEARHDLSALKNRPRGLRINPKRTSQGVVDQLCAIRKEMADAGGRAVAHIYCMRSGKKISHSTVDNIFSREGLTEKYRLPKKNPHTKRYASENPLDRVQMDTVGLKIEDEHGNKVYALSAIDCCSRFAFIHICLEKSTEEARKGLKNYLTTVGKPRLIQTDNGVEFTYYFVSRTNARRQKGERYSAFEQLLEEEKIEHHLIRPRTPQHNGKVERFHRSLLRFVRRRELNGKPLGIIENELREFLKVYNDLKPHTSLNSLTPARVFYKHNPKVAA